MTTKLKLSRNMCIILGKYILGCKIKQGDGDGLLTSNNIYLLVYNSAVNVQ